MTETDTDTETDTQAETGSAETVNGELATAHAVLLHIVAALVKDPSAIRVEVQETPSGTPRMSVRVGQSDMGRVIGKRGRVAQAVRAVVRAAAARDGTDVEVEFED